METLFEKIAKHGIKNSSIMGTRLLFHHIKKTPDRIRIQIMKQMSADGFILKKVQNNMMMLDLNDVGISHELLLTGVHEALSTKQIRKEIKAGMTIVEVGANIGYYSLIEAQIIGDEGKIYAFEPSPKNFKLLTTNIALNGFEGIFETHPNGIGNKSETQKFFLLSKGNMSSFLHRKEDKVIKTEGAVDVQIIRLDDFFDSKEDTIDYVRMDVEGYEFEVLRGMEKILSSNRGPQGLFIEVHSELLNNIGSSCEAFLHYLRGFGYDISIARFRGKEELRVDSMEELLNHELREQGYWEVFFKKVKPSGGHG
jgi:FkbM family methyltransferase